MSQNNTNAPLPEEAHTDRTAPAEIRPEAGGAKRAVKEYFTATRIAYLAIFTALAFVLRLPPFEFVIFPAVEFLKIDFSNTFVMIAGFALGPVAGIIVGVLKEVLYGLMFSQTVGIGELANILFILTYALVPSIVYVKHKGIKTVIVTLAIGCFLQTVLSVPINYLLNFPFYFTMFSGSWTDGMEFYLQVWYWAVLFNLVKAVLITAATLILYKPLSRLIKATAAKFDSKKIKAPKN